MSSSGLSNILQGLRLFSIKIRAGGRFPWALALLLAGLWGWGGAEGSDMARERRLRGEIEAGVRLGESVSLKTGQLDFLALHMAATTPKPKGGVILLHGQGAHPEWATLIQPLRVQLPAHGWETLSVQLPLAAEDAPDGAYEPLIPEAFARIAFALEFLKSRQINQVALVGHGWGARVAVEWLGRDAPPDVAGLVAIGLSADLRRLDSGTLGALRKIQVPVLDLYGSRDLDPVRATASQRAAAARAGQNRQYRQVEMDGADHFFTGLTDALIARVRAWLSRLPQAPARPG